MLVELWGASDVLTLVLPGSPLGYLLLLLETILFFTAVSLITLTYPSAQKPNPRWTIILSVAGLIASQLFPISVLPTAQPIIPFAVFPLLLSAAFLDPISVAIVGLMTGLGQAFGQTHSLFTPYHLAFSGLFAYLLMRQSYMGRFYQIARQPVLAGGLSMVLAACLLAMGAFANTLPATFLDALDHALYQANHAIFAYVLEGMLAGVLVFITMHSVPNLFPHQRLIPSPGQRSLRKRMIINTSAFSLLLLLVLGTAVFNISAAVSRRLILNQMAHNAEIASDRIPDFQGELERLVDAFPPAQFQPDDTVANQTGLTQLHASSTLFQRLMLIDSSQTITAQYPAGENGAVQISPEELEGLAVVFDSREKNIVTMKIERPDEVLSIIVPIFDAQNEQVVSAVVGRIAQISIDNLIVGMQGVADESIGFIVNDDNVIISHPDSTQLRTNWIPEQYGRLLQANDNNQSGAYQLYQPETETRHLVYHLHDQGHNWTVVIDVPYSVVLDLSLRIGLPLLAILLVVSAATLVQLTAQTRGLTEPISEIIKASQTMVAGSSWKPAIHTQRDDEIGQLSQAFSQMQRSMKKRLNELSLLLSVSHDVSNNIDINQGMPAILRGALRGTGASGARAVVLNPSGGNPLTFGEGPAAEHMATLDRRIMSKMRYAAEMLLVSSEEIRTALDLDDEKTISIPSLMAIPLHSHKRFLGVLWFGYRQSHSIDMSERNLLHTLSSQAAVLVENAHLFATAEGGRRRLAAVLASTSDAVIVTDPTDRILLINPAMEHLFNVKASEVTNRSVAGTIGVEPLVTALTRDSDYTHNLEVPVEDGRIFYASVSRITNREGQIFGRVAVLRDITYLKEIDEMKSDFVSTVSHDLRNPLTFMRGYMSMLPMVGEINNKQQEYVDKILAGIDQMTKMVDDLLDLSRIEAGINFEQDEFEVNPLLRDIADEYSQHAYYAGLRIDVEVDPTILTVRGDQSLIRQAITNLVGNSIKYAPKSGKLLLKAGRQNGSVIISVHDQGPGIPEEAQIRLFEKFYRVKQPGTERVKGTGLGLAIVKTIAERHGGTARCHSKVGEGSTFFIELPYKSPYMNGSSNNSNEAT